jgi:hypothetical protein
MGLEKVPGTSEVPGTIGSAIAKLSPHAGANPSFCRISRSCLAVTNGGAKTNEKAFFSVLMV